MLLYIVGAVAVILVIIVAWGVLHFRHSQRVAQEAVLKVSLEDIEPLRDECARVFRERFGETLSMENLEESAQILSARLDNAETLKRAFAKPDFYWYFVLPVGSFIGELLRVHARGEWKASEDGGLEMKLSVCGGSATTYPFDKVLKHLAVGGKADIYAYLMSATRLEEMAGALEDTENQS